MKIVFLDFDGVLCTRRAQIAAGDFENSQPSLDVTAVQMVGRLAEVDPTLRFVISSDWREVYSREEIEAQLQQAGFIGKLHDDWRTPKSGAKRGDQVKAWLDQHPEVTGFVCIDDHKGFHRDQPLVQIRNPEDGFLVQHFRQACQLLFGDEAAWFKAKREIALHEDGVLPHRSGAGNKKAATISGCGF